MIQYVVEWNDPTDYSTVLRKAFRTSRNAEQFMDKLIAAAKLLDDADSGFASSLSINMEIE